MHSSAIKLHRGEPISIPLTTSNLTWRRVAALVEYEMKARDWTRAETCLRAYRIIRENGVDWEHPLSDKALTLLLRGKYVRGGPHFATLERIFCRAFASSGYEIVLSAKGARLTNGRGA